jgi:hypothetical protein
MAKSRIEQQLRKSKWNQKNGQGFKLSCSGGGLVVPDFLLNQGKCSLSMIESSLNLVMKSNSLENSAVVVLNVL